MFNNIYLDKLCSISVSNKYLTWYCQIISNALQRASTKKQATKLFGYSERHHILPVSFRSGGKKDIDNLVYLTAKEHILCHELLCKFSAAEYYIQASRAFHCMCFKTNGGRNKRKPSLRQLASARELARIANSGPRGIRCAPSWSNCNSVAEFKECLSEKVEQNLSDPTIGEFFGVSATAIFIWRKKLNIANRRPLIRDKAHLSELYTNQKMSASEIGKVLNCTGAAVQQYLTKFKIPIRSASDRQKLKLLPIHLRN